MSEQTDDFELEVSRLTSPSAAPSPVAPDSDDAASPLSASSVPSYELSAHPLVLGTRPTRQQRLLRAGRIGTLLIALLIAVFLLPPGNRDAVLSHVIPPTPLPTATPQAGYDAFLWEHSVPWGQLVIDGKPGPNVRGSAVHWSSGNQWEGTAFHLPRGRHSLEYRAAPFPTLSCVVSVPLSRNDTCPLERTGDFYFLVPQSPAARLLDLRATMDRLPKAEAEALTAQAQAEVTAALARLSTGTLMVGDHYLTSAGQIAQATTTLHIQPQIRFDASVIASFNGLPCVPLCTATSLLPLDSAEAGWPVEAPIALSWRYTTAAGQVIQDNGPAIWAGASPVTLIKLLTRWTDGGWQSPIVVSDAPETDPVICPTGGHALDVLRAMPGQTTTNPDYQWPYLASTSELGCLLAGSQRDPTTGTSTGPIALVFYRAGALVVANAEAQRVFPTLPMASAHERVLAQAVAPTTLN